jgi:hypothetical protein
LEKGKNANVRFVPENTRWPGPSSLSVRRADLVVRLSFRLDSGAAQAVSFKHGG